MLLTTLSLGRGKKKSKAATGIGALILLSILVIYLSSTYSFMMGAAFSALGGLDIMLMMMVVMAIVFPFIFIVFVAQSLVFSAKDADLVLSLPVSSFSVMLARVLALYLESLMLVELMLIPAGVAYLFFGGAGGAVFIITLLLEGFFLALLPTFLALLFGALIALVVSRLPFKNLLTVLFSLLMIVGIMALSMSLSFTSSTAAISGIDIAGLRGSILSAMPPLGWIVGGMMGNVVDFLLVIAFTAVPFFAIVWIFSHFYKGILTRLSSHHLRTDYKLRGIKSTGSFAALFKKESRKFFGTPAFILNAGISIFLSIAACVAAVIYKSTVMDVIAEMAGGGLDISNYMSPLLLGVLGFFACIIYSSSVSISLEGKTLWILKEAPVSTGKIFGAKVGFGFTLSAFSMLVCMPLLAFAFDLPALEAVAMLIVGLLFSALTSSFGLLANLFLPRMDADNDTIVIKQSASVLVAMLFDFVVYGICIFLFFTTRALGFLAYCGIIGAVLLLLTALALLLLNTKGRKLFAAL